MKWEGLQRDEFGFLLWDVVKACGAIKQMRSNKNRHPSRIQPGQLTAWQAEETRLIAFIAQSIPNLAPEDQCSILASYPWVLEC